MHMTTKNSRPNETRTMHLNSTLRERNTGSRSGSSFFLRQPFQLFVETLHFFLNLRIISSEYVTKISSSRLSNTSIRISRTIINISCQFPALKSFILACSNEGNSDHESSLSCMALLFRTNHNQVPKGESSTSIRRKVPCRDERGSRGFCI